MANIGNGNPNFAESWRLFFRLRLVHNLGFKNLTVELNFSVIMFCMNSNMDDLYSCVGFLKSCKKFISIKIDIRIQHVIKKCNKVADALARKSHSLVFNFSCLYSLLNFVR